MHETEVPRGERVAAMATNVLLAATAALLLIFTLAGGLDRIISIIPDDAAYYLGIAENVARGAGETFDGVNATNGYQPLWLYLLSALYRLHTAAPGTMLRAVLVLQAILLIVASVLLYRWCVRFIPRRVILPVAILFLVFVAVPAVNGMESAILVTMLTLLIVLGWKVGVTGPSSFAMDLLFGMVTGLVVLARLDMVFLPAVVCALCLWRAIAGRADRIAYIRKAVAAGLGTALIVAPYLIRNYLVYGAVMPISGALKSSFPHASPPGYAFSRLGTGERAAVLVAVLYLAWAVLKAGRVGAAKRHRRGARDRDEAAGPRAGAGAPGLDYFELTVAVLSATVVLHVLHTVLFMKWAIFKWHFLVYLYTSALALCVPAARLFRRESPVPYRTAYWVGVAMLAGLCGFFVAERYGNRSTAVWGVASYRAACWAREHTPPDAVFAMKDAGYFGYFSRRSVINLDGVVNNREYQEAIRERKVNAYLAGMHVDYLVQHAFWDRDDINDGTYAFFPATYTSRLYGTESDTVLLRREWEVYRSEPYLDGPYRTVFLIWKLGGRRDTG